MVKLEIGKSYTLNNGLTTSPLRKSNNGTNYTFEADVKRSLDDDEPSILSWLPTGKYVGANVESEYDIIN